jgi:hypothetical protein
MDPPKNAILPSVARTAAHIFHHRDAYFLTGKKFPHPANLGLAERAAGAGQVPRNCAAITE